MARIEGSDRLVDEEHRRPRGESPGEQHAGPLAAGQFGGGAALEPASPTDAMAPATASRPSGGRASGLSPWGRRPRATTLSTGIGHATVPFWARYAMACARDGRRICAQIVAIQRHGAGRSAGSSPRGPQQGRLAGTVWTDHHREAPGLEGEVDLAQRPRPPSRPSGRRRSGGSRGNLRQLGLATGDHPQEERHAEQRRQHADLDLRLRRGSGAPRYRPRAAAPRRQVPTASGSGPDRSRRRGARDAAPRGRRSRSSPPPPPTRRCRWRRRRR